MTTRHEKPAFNQKRAEFGPEKVLVNWRVMRKALPEMTEAELERALEYERSHEERKDFIFRIARRLSRLKSEREFQELLT